MVLIVLCEVVTRFVWLSEDQLVEIDELLAGLAAAGPAFEDRLEQEDRLRKGQAGRG
jgi:hypothetical protein